MEFEKVDLEKLKMHEHTFLVLQGQQDYLSKNFVGGVLPKAGDKIELVCVKVDEGKISIQLQTVKCCEGGPQWGHAFNCPSLP